MKEKAEVEAVPANPKKDATYMVTAKKTATTGNKKGGFDVDIG